VATGEGKTGTIPAFALGPKKTKKNLCRDRKICVEMEKPVSRWKNLCRDGKICVKMEKAVSR
jgi:hypothetical protein